MCSTRNRSKAGRLSRSCIVFSPILTAYLRDHLDMAITVLCFTVRKPGMTFQDFKLYYEQHHSVNAVTYLGNDAPSTYSRHYVERKRDGESSHTAANGSPPLFFTGLADSFEYDCVTVMTWKDAAAMDSMAKKFSQPDVVASFAADEEKFLDRRLC